MSDLHELAREQHDNNREFIRQANKAAVSLAIATLKGLLLINGGAAVATMGFVASVVSKNEPLKIDVTATIRALEWFGWGVAASVLSSGVSYAVMYLQAGLAQSFEYLWDPPYMKNGRFSKRYLLATYLLQLLAVLTAIASLVLFLKGVTLVAGTVGGG